MEQIQNRNKNAVNVRYDVQVEARHLVEEFQRFTSGYHCLFLIHRHKEGGEPNNSKVRKIIVNDKKEYQFALEQLLTEQYESKDNLRIYASVNERNFDKAIRKFKHEQLDAEDQNTHDHHDFYIDVKNRFVGCLMQPSQRATSYFLWDIDTKDDMPFMEQLPEDVIIYLKYPTKQGWHIITEPFNYTKMELPPEAELKKDGLLLLKFNQV